MSAWFALLFVVFAWGLMGVPDRIALEGATPLQIVRAKAVVWVFVLAATVGWWLPQKEQMLPPWPYLGWALVAEVLVVFAVPAYLYAMSRLGAGTAIAIAATANPVVLVAAARVFLSETITGTQAVGIVLACAGVALLSLGKGAAG